MGPLDPDGRAGTGSGPPSAADLAHDFNNVIGLILNYADLARRNGVSPDLRNYLDEITRAANRAVGLAQQVAALAPER